MRALSELRPELDRLSSLGDSVRATASADRRGGLADEVAAMRDDAALLASRLSDDVTQLTASDGQWDALHGRVAAFTAALATQQAQLDGIGAAGGVPDQQFDSVKVQRTITGDTHRGQTQGTGTGDRHGGQARGTGTGDRCRGQAQGTGMGDRHGGQARGTGTGDTHGGHAAMQHHICLHVLSYCVYLDCTLYKINTLIQKKYLQKKCSLRRKFST